MGNRIIEISSRQNPWIRRFSRALDRHREEIVLEGPRFVSDALLAGVVPLAIAVRSDLDVIPAADAPTLLVETRLFNDISDAVTSQGIAGLFERPRTSADILRSPLSGPVVVLDGIQDPGNVGTIVRLAAAFDAAAVVTTNGSADPWGPKAARASAGAVLAVPILEIASAELPAHFARWGANPFFADMSGDTRTVLPRDAALILGSEGRGVSDPLRKIARPLAVPMSPRVESLNVAAAAAIILSRSWGGAVPR